MIMDGSQGNLFTEATVVYTMITTTLCKTDSRDRNLAQCIFFSNGLIVYLKQGDDLSSPTSPI